MGFTGIIMRAAIRGYQLFISPVLPGSCRYWPSCSQYGMQAIARHGALKGGWLTLWRVLRCNPWGGWGWDPVPPAGGERECAHHPHPAGGAAANGGQGD